MIIPSKALSQEINSHQLERLIDKAYQKAYPACVRIFAFDTLSGHQAGGQFSGVVVSNKGEIFSAAHVTTPGSVYKVNFPDGKSCLAIGLGKIVLANDKTIPDVAMLKIITPGSWPYAELGRSADLKVYEPCISTSYPESLDQPEPTLRFGYISVVKNERGFIRSTCLMEPGDSGGPLFDLMGRLIGLHSAIEIDEADNYDVPVDLFIKYRTALTEERIFSTYPDNADSVGVDPRQRQIISLPGLKNYKEFFGSVDRLASACLTVVSIQGDKAQDAGCTLFTLSDLSNSESKYKQVIVSKSSLVGNSPVIIYAGHDKVSARVIARDKDNDLVLLSPAHLIRGGISHQITDTSGNQVTPGRFLVSPQPNAQNTVSISGSAVFLMPKIINAGFMGIGFNSRTPPFTITHIFPDLNSTIYQLRINDTLESVNDSISTDLNHYFYLLQRFWPGDTVRIRIRRGNESLIRKIVLDTIPQRHINHPAEKFAGGKSERRDGFKAVFTHDALLKPNNCGGPVFDLNGHFMGVNIARYSRVSCLTIPARDVYQFIIRSVGLSAQ